MSGLAKVSEALNRLQGNDVAQALSGIVVAQKSDSTNALLKEVQRRIGEALEGGDAEAIDGVAKSAAGLLAIAAGTCETRVMSQGEFEEHAAGAITKAAEDGATEAQLGLLRAALDAAVILFDGDNVGKSFAMPVLDFAKAEAAAEEPPAEGGNADGEAAAEGGEAEVAAEGGEADAAKNDDDGEGDESAAAEGEAGEASAESGEAGEAAAEGGEADAEGVNKAAGDAPVAWPSDMNSKEFMSGDAPADPEWGFDPKQA